MTMSISSAPLPTASRTSASLTSRLAGRLGGGGEAAAPPAPHFRPPRALPHGVADVGELDLPAGAAAGEGGGDGGDVDAGALERLPRDAGEGAVDAHGGARGGGGER